MRPLTRATVPLPAVAVLTLLLALCLAAVPLAGARADEPPPPPAPTSPTEPCDSLSPIAIPCTAVGKVVDAVGAECRRVGIPDALCVLPLAHKVTQAARDAYLQSWVHRTARFQYALGDPLQFWDAQWIGTHNSFNSLADSFTLSQADSNQQLSLTQQLDLDVRALEIDLHYVPRLERLGMRAVTVCHGQGPEVGDLGCTFEPLFTQVLPKIVTWLNAPEHADEVLLLYLEDNLGQAPAYASAVATLEQVLRRPDGSSLIYRPDPRDWAAGRCSPLPMDSSRDDVRASGARVMLVGSCAPGWSSVVFDWDAVHVEGGSAAAYESYPACDGSYGPSVYEEKLVRYFEDTTLVSNLLDPTRPPANPEALTPAKVQAMTNCGVNVFGLDQLLPEDGRIQATLWSWAPDEPVQTQGRCTLQGADSRWVAVDCAEEHPAACYGGEWLVTTPVAFADAEAACGSLGATFVLPRTGNWNADAHAVTGAVGGAWLDFRLS
jgi:hypothetical protein